MGAVSTEAERLDLQLPSHEHFLPEKRKKPKGFCRMEKSKTAVLRPKVCTDELKEMDMQGGILLEECLGSYRSQEK